MFFLAQPPIVRSHTLSGGLWLTVLVSFPRMAPELGRIGPIVIRTYALFLDMAVLAGLGWLAWQGHRIARQPVAWLDAGLGALVGGIAAGRLGHAAIHWAYFSEHPEQIGQVWRGGLDWHAGVVGGLIGLVLVCRWRGVDFPAALDALAVMVPVWAALISTGCLMGSCGHGREVSSLADYPPLVAAELPDLYGVVLPRLASQLYGIVWAGIVLIITVAALRRINQPGGRFWPVLGLLAGGAFAIGFTRGDAAPMVGALRLDQILDLAIAALALLGMWLWAGLPYRLYGPSGFIRR